MAVASLKRRSEFLRVRGGRRWACPAFVIEAKPRSSDAGQTKSSGEEHPGARFGFTITRKIGSAVVRNRIRRRLREALRTLPSGLPTTDMDYVVVARAPASTTSFAELQALLARALRNVQVDRAKPSRHPRA